MEGDRSLENYTETVGGIFHFDDFEAIPYNHWKRDCEWIVLLRNPYTHASFIIPIRALTARDACHMALDMYNYTTKDDYDL